MFKQTFSGEQMKSYKLPPVRLPTFNGDMKDWVEFKATCRSILTDKVHDVHRLQQLKDALTGEPRELVAHILPSTGAYDKAMVLLKQRYENARAIVNSQLHRFYSLAPNEPSHESANTLRVILNTINSLKAALKGCEIDTSTWDPILIFNSSQCLHADSHKAWEEKLEGSRAVPTFNQYLEFLETRIIILDTTLSTYAGLSKAKPPIKPTAAMQLQAKDKAKIFFTLRSDYKCTICQRNHLSYVRTGSKNGC